MLFPLPHHSLPNIKVGKIIGPEWQLWKCRKSYNKLLPLCDTLGAWEVSVVKLQFWGWTLFEKRYMWQRWNLGSWRSILIIVSEGFCCLSIVISIIDLFRVWEGMGLLSIILLGPHFLSAPLKLRRGFYVKFEFYESSHIHLTNLVVFSTKTAQNSRPVGVVLSLVKFGFTALWRGTSHSMFSLYVTIWEFAPLEISYPVASLYTCLCL